MMEADLVDYAMRDIRTRLEVPLDDTPALDDTPTLDELPSESEVSKTAL